MNDSLITKKYTQQQIDSAFNDKGIKAHYVTYPEIRRSDTYNFEINDSYKRWEPKGKFSTEIKKEPIFEKKQYEYDNEFKAITFFLILSLWILRLIK